MGLLKWLRRKTPTVRDNADDLITSVLQEVSIQDRAARINRYQTEWKLMENHNYRDYVEKKLRKRLPKYHSVFDKEAGSNHNWYLSVSPILKLNLPGLSLDDRFTV